MQLRPLASFILSMGPSGVHRQLIAALIDSISCRKCLGFYERIYSRHLKSTGRISMLLLVRLQSSAPGGSKKTHTVAYVLNKAASPHGQTLSEFKVLDSYVE